MSRLVGLPQGQGFDVSFKTPQLLASFWNKFETVRESFSMFEVEKLTDDSLKHAVLRMYNETVESEDLLKWLGHYCVVIGSAIKVADPDGIWNGSWHVPIKLHEDRSGYGGV